MDMTITNDQAAEAARIAMAIVYALSGLYLLMFGSRIGTARASIKAGCADSDTERARMGKALDARDALESSRAKYWVPTGVFEIAIAILTLTTSIAVTTAYALFMLGSAVMIGLSQFMHGRRTTRRAASLESSRPSDASQWLALFPQLSVLASLAFLDVAPVGSVLIALAGSAILALAYSVLRNPSFAAGDDPIVERYIDSRLRSLRFVLIAAAATAPAFLFCLLTELASPHTLLHLSAMLVAQGSFVAMMIAQIAFVIARSLEDRAGRWWTKAGSA